MMCNEEYRNVNVENDRNEGAKNVPNDVMHSAFLLARSLKRRPAREPDAHRFPPSVERTLIVVSRADGMSTRDLSEALDIRPSSATELVNKLAEAGLVERKEDPQDKRLTHICLTEEGKTAAEEIKSRHQQRVEEFSSCFTEEEAREFCALANKLSAHLEEINGGEDAGARGRCGGPRHHGNPGHCGGPGRHGNRRPEGPGFPSGHGHHGPHPDFGPGPGFGPGPDTE